MRLEIDGVTRRFGRTFALDKVSFTLDEPGICGFVGPNGAGKTTLLRIVAGFDEPDSGDVRVDGVSAVEYPEKFRRTIGFMPDTLPGAKDITVGAYLDFHAAAFGFRGDEKQQVLDRVCKTAVLDEMLEKRLHALSKGMKQRVSLARILIQDPSLILLDEPAAGLDPRARVELRDILLDLAKRGKTIFLSSHILSELEDMISGLVIIERGKLVSSGKFGAAAAAPESPSGEEVVLVGVADADMENYAARFRELPCVEKCAVSASGRRPALTLVIRRGSFAEVLGEVANSGFPLAELRRPELAPDLERVFLEQTTGGVQ